MIKLCFAGVNDATHLHTARPRPAPSPARAPGTARQSGGRVAGAVAVVAVAEQPAVRLGRDGR